MVALMLGLDRLHEAVAAGGARAPIATHASELAAYARKALAACRRLQPVCNACGGTAVQADAWACWDFDAQRWVLHGTCEAAAICADCDIECSYAMKPVAQRSATDGGNAPAPHPEDC